MEGSPFANRSTLSEKLRVGTGFASPRYHGFASSGSRRGLNLGRARDRHHPVSVLIGPNGLYL
jgi:hypothetical protein